MRRADLIVIIVGGSLLSLAVRLATGVAASKAVGMTFAGLIGGVIVIKVLGDRILAWANRSTQGT